MEVTRYIIKKELVSLYEEERPEIPLHLCVGIEKRSYKGIVRRWLSVNQEERPHHNHDSILILNF
jgi:hypothetical protein